MKILQINASYKPAFIYGGPTMSVSMLAEQLAKAGHYVEVFTTTANGKNELNVIAGQQVLVDGVMVTYFKRVSKDHTHFSPALLSKLWRQCKKFDVVHIHGWWNMVSVLSCLVAITRRIPVVVSPRGMLSNYSFQNKNNRKKYLINSLLGKPLLKDAFIHATSVNEFNAIENILTAKAMFNIPNFIKLPVKTQYNKLLPSERLKLIFFSRVEEKKGLDILLHSLKNISIPYSLTIAGDGKAVYIDHLKGIIRTNDLSDKVNWIGFQQENKFGILAQHDLMILPSHDENFGNVVIESLSAGTAVLISKNVGLADYVKENGFGWLCDVNASSIRSSLITIYDNRNQLKHIANFAPAKIKNDFNEDNLIKQYIDMYNQIIHS